MQMYERLVIENDYLADDSVTLKAHEKIFGGNRYTGLALYYPLMTCNGKTEGCGGLEGHCYVNNVYHLTMRTFIKKTLKVYKFVERTDIDQVIERMLMEIPRGQKNIRFLGSGDLTPKLVKVVNRLVEVEPTLQVYLYSKILNLLKQVNAKVARNFSIDATTPRNVIEKLKEYRGEFIVNYVKMPGEVIAADVEEMIEVLHPFNQAKKKMQPDEKTCDKVIVQGTQCGKHCFRCVIPKRKAE